MADGANTTITLIANIPDGVTITPSSTYRGLPVAYNGLFSVVVKEGYQIKDYRLNNVTYTVEQMTTLELNEGNANGSSPMTGEYSHDITINLIKVNNNEIKYLNKIGLKHVIDTIKSTFANKKLDNVQNADFYSKGIASGLGQVIPEIQPTIEVYVTGISNGIITLSNNKPPSLVTLPFTITTTGTTLRFRYVYTEKGIVSSLSKFKLVIYAESMQTNVDYEFSATQTININSTDMLVGGDLYSNKYAITNPRIEIPLENNQLPTNIERNTGDYMDIELRVTKSTGTPDNINIISSPILTSKLVRNGGDIGSTNVVDFSGVDTKTQFQRNREYEGDIKNRTRNRGLWVSSPTDGLGNYMKYDIVRTQYNAYYMSTIDNNANTLPTLKTLVSNGWENISYTSSTIYTEVSPNNKFYLLGQSSTANSASYVNKNLSIYIGSDNALYDSRGLVANKQYADDTFLTKPVEVSKTLLTASWTGTTAPYTYTLTGVTEVKSSKTLGQMTYVKQGATSNENYLIWKNAIENADIIFADELQDVGKLVLKAWGTKPTIDLPILLLIGGDEQ